MASIIALIIVALGACGLVEFIRHSSFGQEFNLKIQTNPSSPALLKQLMGCGFCQAHHAVFICMLLWFLIPYGNYAVIYLAAVRLSNMFNDIPKKFNKSPNRMKDHI